MNKAPLLNGTAAQPTYLTYLTRFRATKNVKPLPPGSSAQIRGWPPTWLPLRSPAAVLALPDRRVEQSLQRTWF